ncbi:unnamed protein product [Rangifer tarandus platyrhynchus]|uniref:Uncharacterized protein n=1 Tax=Rangifer tarandus platyrhynchus TaxID=3082113 RepID=A0ABN8YL27_RANTA|nr:unnamed protein product [Rangifer tarandus platyrhynchus]
MAFTVSRMHGAASRPGPEPSLTRCSLLVLLLVDADALGDLGGTHRVWCLAAWMPWSTASCTSCISLVSGSCKVDALTGVIQAHSGVNILRETFKPQLGSLEGRSLASPLRCSLLYISGQEDSYLTRQQRKDDFLLAQQQSSL